MSDRFTAPTTVHLSGYADCHLRDHERIKELEAELAAASRQLWDKDDALTKLHRQITALHLECDCGQGVKDERNV